MSVRARIALLVAVVVLGCVGLAFAATAASHPARISGRVVVRHLVQPMVCTVKQCPVCPGNCVVPNRVRVATPTGTTVASVRLRRDRFATQIGKPGRYVVRLLGGRKVLARRTVSVRAHRTTHVTFHVSVG